MRNERFHSVLKIADGTTSGFDLNQLAFNVLNPFVTFLKNTFHFFKKAWLKGDIPGRTRDAV
jgi:hypothetical protein